MPLQDDHFSVCPLKFDQSARLLSWLWLATHKHSSAALMPQELRSSACGREQEGSEGRACKRTAHRRAWGARSRGRPTRWRPGTGSRSAGCSRSPRRTTCAGSAARSAAATGSPAEPHAACKKSHGCNTVHVTYMAHKYTSILLLPPTEPQKYKPTSTSTRTCI